MNENAKDSYDDGDWLNLNNQEDTRLLECKSKLRKKNFSDKQIEEFLTKVWISVFVEDKLKYEQDEINRSLTNVPKAIQGIQKELFKFRNETGKFPDGINPAAFGINTVDYWLIVSRSSRKKIDLTDPNKRQLILSRGRQLISMCVDAYNDKLIEPIAIALSIAFNLKPDDDLDPESLRKSYESQIKKRNLK